MRESLNIVGHIPRDGACGRLRLRRGVLSLATMLAAATLDVGALAAVKKVPYPEVKVTINEGYKPDPAFEKMRSAFTAALAKKDVAALTELVAPTFLWTVNGQPADKMDLGRDALYNFKVVFGFRTPGKDEDGGVGNGPFWDTLAAFAA